MKMWDEDLDRIYVTCLCMENPGAIQFSKLLFPTVHFRVLGGNLGQKLKVVVLIVMVLVYYIYIVILKCKALQHVGYLQKNLAQLNERLKLRVIVISGVFLLCVKLSAQLHHSWWCSSVYQDVDQ